MKAGVRGPPDSDTLSPPSHSESEHHLLSRGTPRGPGSEAGGLTHQTGGESGWEYHTPTPNSPRSSTHFAPCLPRRVYTLIHLILVITLKSRNHQLPPLYR